MQMASDEEKEPEIHNPIDVCVLRGLRPKLIPDIVPSYLVIHLYKCLTILDEQKIRAKEQNEGPSIGALELLDRLVRHQGWWDVLIEAFRHDDVKLGHLADLMEEELKKELGDSGGSKNIQPNRDNTVSQGNGAEQPPVKKDYGNSTSKISETSETTDGHYGLEAGVKKIEVSDGGEVADGATPIWNPLQLTKNVRKAQRRTQSPAGNESSPITYKNDRQKISVSKINTYRLPAHLKMPGIEIVSPKDMPDLRKYQLELADAAIKGENSLVCAPTGSGKTMVALHVCKAHLEESLVRTLHTQTSLSLRRPTQTPVKVVYATPRYALLQQVYKHFHEHLPLWKIAKRSGGTAEKVQLSLLLEQNDVVVVTAAILKNALEEGSVKISDISLLVMDECHHTMLDHPYNIIMSNFYLKMKLENQVAKLPQVLGLTASPGAGKAQSIEGAKQHILKLCANLDAKFVTVQEHIEELEMYTATPTKHSHRKSVRENNPFNDLVEDIMTKIEKKIKEESPHPKATQPYENWVAEIKKSAVYSKDNCTRKCCEHLAVYNNAMRCCDTVQMQDGLAILEEFHSELKRRGSGLDETESWLLKLYNDNITKLTHACTTEAENPNPKLVALKEAILDQQKTCKQNDEAFRAIIFVRTKEMTKAMVNWIASTPELKSLNPAPFIGVNTQTERGRMTTTDQKATLTKFDSGEYQILVSTTVGEEGIDIAACNMVVRYDYVTNEISMIQARGRARKQEAVEVVIADAKTTGKDQINVLREERMEVAMELVHAMSDEEYKTEINQHQNTSVANRTYTAQALANLQDSNTNTSIKLICKGCNNFVCFASNIQKCNIYFINPEPNFKEKVTFKEHHDERKRKLGTMKIYCAACDYDWGNTHICKKCSRGPSHGHPCLKIESFVIEINDKYVEKKKWKDVPFKVQNV